MKFSKKNEGEIFGENGMTRRQHFFVLFFFAVGALGLTYPIATSPGNLLGNSADPHLITWQLAHTSDAFSHGFRGFWDSNIFYPNARTYLYTEHLLGLAFFAWPIVAATGNTVLAYSLMALLSFIVTGWGMVFLLRLWVRSFPLALCGAVLVTFSSFFFIHFYQLHVLFFAFVPLVFASLFLWFRTDHLLYLAAFTFFMIWQIASSGNYGLMLFPLLAILTVAWISLLRGEGMRRRLLFFATSWGAIIAAFILFYAPYLPLSLGRSLEEIRLYSLSLRDYIIVSPILYERGILEAPETSERFFLIGIVTTLVILGGIGICMKRFTTFSHTQRREFALVSIVLVTAFLLSLGPFIHWNTENGIVGPYYFFYRFVPGYDTLRSLGRMTIFVLLALVVLAVRGWDVVLRRLRPRMQWGISGVVIAAFVVELIQTPFVPLWLERVPTYEQLPAVYHWLLRRPSDEVMIELPIDASPHDEGKYIYASAYHKKKTINGYSGYFPDSFVRASEVMTDFPSDESIAFLDEVGVNIVVIHWAWFPSKEREERELSLSTNSRFRRVFEDGNDAVYELLPTP